MVFEKKVTLGNVLTVLTLLVGIGMNWATFSERMDNSNQRIKALEMEAVRKDVNDAAQKSLIMQLEMINNRLGRVEAKIDQGR